MKLALLGLLVVLGLCGQTAPLADAEIWTQFENWAEKLKALPPGQRIALKDRFVKDLGATGVGEQEAGGALNVPPFCGARPQIRSVSTGTPHSKVAGDRMLRCSCCRRRCAG